MRGVEFVPSDDFQEDIRILEELLSFFEVDFVLIPDNPLGNPSVSSLVSATMIANALGIKTIATIGGGGRSKEVVRSCLKGVKYADLLGVACVSGDCQGSYRISALEILELAREFEFFKIVSMRDLKAKIQNGATHAITQPLFDSNRPFVESIPVFWNFMPVFSHSTFAKIAKNQEQLGFDIPSSYQNSSDLMAENARLLEMILSSCGNLYLTPLNLKKQLPYLKELLT